jgi:hypothetical protein
MYKRAYAYRHNASSPQFQQLKDEEIIALCSQHDRYVGHSHFQRLSVGYTDIVEVVGVAELHAVVAIERMVENELTHEHAASFYGC